jgi:hypothetical protein
MTGRWSWRHLAAGLLGAAVLLGASVRVAYALGVLEAVLDIPFGPAILPPAESLVLVRSVGVLLPLLEALGLLVAFSALAFRAGRWLGAVHSVGLLVTAITYSALMVPHVSPPLAALGPELVRATQLQFASVGLAGIALALAVALTGRLPWIAAPLWLAAGLASLGVLRATASWTYLAWGVYWIAEPGTASLYASTVAMVPAWIGLALGCVIWSRPSTSGVRPSG